MHRLLVAVACCAVLLGAMAQQPDTLVFSQSLVAVKIRDAKQQVVTFTPLLELLDGLVASRSTRTAAAGAPVKSMTASLQEVVANLQAMGVDPAGDLWLLHMPPAPDNLPDPTAAGLKLDKDKLPSSYLVLPLKDPQRAQQFLNANPDPKAPRGVICGNTAVLALTGPKPAFTAINNDLTLRSTRGIVALVNPGNLDMGTLAANAPPLLINFLAPLVDVVEEQQANIRQIEVGMTMEDDDLLVESFMMPVPGSDLAKAIATPPADQVMEYAAYLPPQLAYAGVSGPMITGAAGTSYTLMRIGFGLLGMFLPPERGQAFADSFQQLAKECSQGRALGLTALPANKQIGCALVGIYHVTGEKNAKTVARTFVKEFMLTRDSVMGGMLSNTILFQLKEGAETIAGVPIDLVTVKVVPPAAESAVKTDTKTAPVSKPISLECRIGYVGDKMLVTLARSGGREQMADLLTRMQQHKAGFTDSDRFTALKPLLPEKQLRGFETISSLDICRIAASWMPDGKDKTNLQTFFNLFPPQRTAITTSQAFQDDCLRGDIRIPGDQLNFVYTVLKSAIEFGGQQPPAQ